MMHNVQLEDGKETPTVQSEKNRIIQRWVIKTDDYTRAYSLYEDLPDHIQQGNLSIGYISKRTTLNREYRQQRQCINVLIFMQCTLLHVDQYRNVGFGKDIHKSLSNTFNTATINGRL